jgi:tetratricopeptide (TPR) repeat protein
MEELDDRYGAASAWDTCGVIHHRTGDNEQAIACFGRSLDRYAGQGDRYGTSEVLTHLGDAHHARGDRTAARTAWRQSLEILDDLGHADAHAVRAKLIGSL